ncbi:MAG: TIGR00341 family protein [ANME-2 cluster archaeon]|nr:TIGR00341 family protein [ANME-2 cluster archaeon]MDF1532629.1 TIGR00341 family protein [ANME-2 cluster archaeon]
MALRQIEIFIPSKEEYRVQDALKDLPVLGIWQERFSKDFIQIIILLDAETSEFVLDRLEQNISLVEGYRIIILPVEATLPKQKPLNEKVPEMEEPVLEDKTNEKPARISREELYSDIEETINQTRIFIILAFLSSVVAAIGILQNNVAVIIGAMVIAPLLGPNVALSLATTLGDIDLAKRALKANIKGMLTVLSFAVILGFVFKVDPNIPELISRTKVTLGDIILALAAGSAAALSLTTGVPSALIGVMVAVALLPPLVVFGLLLGQGEWVLATGALLLVLTNAICINLSGVVTFLIQGIRPRKYRDADRAKKATIIALILWTFLLILLGVSIVLSQKW